MENKTVKRCDRITVDKQKIRRDIHGNGRFNAAFARSGVLSYSLGNGKVRKEYRPDVEVFAKSSLDSLAEAAVTRGHIPGHGFIDPTNTKIYRKGHVSPTLSLRRDMGLIEGEIVMYADEDIEAVIEGGETAISPTYSVQLLEEPGVTPEGENYDAVQTNIIYNSIAFIPAGSGRQGGSVSIRLDSEDYILDESTQDNTALDNAGETIMETPLAIVRIDSVDVELKAEAVQVAVDAMAKKLEEQVAAVSVLQARCDAADKEITKLSDPERINTAAKVRAELLTNAAKYSEERLDSMNETELKTVVIKKFDSSVELEGKDASYIQAMYDIACKKLSAQRADGVLAMQHILNVPGSAQPANPALTVKDELEAQRKRNAELRNLAK